MTETKEDKVSRAWLLDFGKGLQAAVGVHEMSHIELSMKLFEIPRAPMYCNEVIIWQDEILPVVDLPSLVAGKKVLRTTRSVIGICIYQERSEDLAIFGAMHLSTTPTGIYVSDTDMCELPGHQKFWQLFSVSCFNYNGITVPVLDFSALFSEKLAKVAAQKNSHFTYH